MEPRLSDLRSGFGSYGLGANMSGLASNSVLPLWRPAHPGTPVSWCTIPSCPCAMSLSRSYLSLAEFYDYPGYSSYSWSSWYLKAGKLTLSYFYVVPDVYFTSSLRWCLFGFGSKEYILVLCVQGQGVLLLFLSVVLRGEEMDTCFIWRVVARRWRGCVEGTLVYFRGCTGIVRAFLGLTIVAVGDILHLSIVGCLGSVFGDLMNTFHVCELNGRSKIVLDAVVLYI